MYKSIAAIAALAASVAAVPVDLSSTSTDVAAASSGEVIAYWGNGNGKDLKSYCVSGSGIDIVVMSFLDQYGGGKAPSGGFNEPSDGYCSINSDGSGNCPHLASDIKYCQSQGKKIFISLGGGGAPGAPTSQGDAEGIAYTLWNSYGNPAYKDSGDNSPRPFGSVFVNGFDLDIEDTNGEGNYKYLVSKLRTYFARDSGNKYYIHAAPQCVLPEANMGQIINSVAIDYMFVQFYNNYQNCDASNYVYGPQAQGASFNYDAWTSYLSGTPNKNTKLIVGIPASRSAAASQSWIDPKDLGKLVSYVKAKPLYGGIGFWEASESDKYSSNNCNFAQEVKSLLTTGHTC